MHIDKKIPGLVTSKFGSPDLTPLGKGLFWLTDAKVNITEIILLQLHTYLCSFYQALEEHSQVPEVKDNFYWIRH